MTLRDSPIFLFLITVHLKRFTYMLRAVKVEKRMTALIPIFLRSSCSGSAAQLRKVVTSLAICEVVAGVPGTVISGNSGVKADQEAHTIVIFDKVIEEQARHRYSAAREVRIVVHAFTYFDTSRRINVTSKEREQVVLPGVVQLKPLGSSNVCARTAPPWRALMIRLRSGGSAPWLEARAASSLA